MSETIELYAYMALRDTFSQRGWANPHTITVDSLTTGPSLLALLNIPEAEVGGFFVNRRAHTPAQALIRRGDRVALFSPGAVRVLDLGVHNRTPGIAS